MALLVQPDAADHRPYLIGPEDVIEIMVWKNPDLSREIIIRPDGHFSFPLIGDVQAAGLTTADLTALITERLYPYYQSSPEVAVIVQQPNSHSIYVLGRVEKQGKFVVGNGVTLLQAIALAGGFQEFASRNKIIVRRKGNGGGEATIRVRYQDVLREKEKNLVLQPGDTLIVP